MTHHARMTMHFLTVGQAAIAQLTAPIMASPHQSPMADLSSITATARKTASPISYRQRQAMTSGLGRATAPRASSSPAIARFAPYARGGELVVITADSSLGLSAGRGPRDRCPGTGSTLYQSRRIQRSVRSGRSADPGKLGYGHPARP